MVHRVRVRLATGGLLETLAEPPEADDLKRACHRLGLKIIADQDEGGSRYIGAFILRDDVE